MSGFWNNTHDPYRQDKAIVGSVHFNATKGVTIESTNVGLNSRGKKVVPAGLFLAKVGGTNRFLPRDYVQADVTSSPNIEVSMPEIFLAGDEIYHLEPSGLITLANTWAANDTITIRFSEPSLGINVSYTHTQAGANLAALDDELVAALNEATNPLYPFARFEVGSTGQIIPYTRGLVFTMSVTATTAGDGTATVTTAISNAPVLLGTVSSVDFANSTLVLGANSAINLKAGARIGTLVEEVYGLYNHSKDFSDRNIDTLKAIDRCDRVYKSGMPYFDYELASRFPNMIFQ